MFILLLLIVIFCITIYCNLSVESQNDIKTTFKKTVSEIRSWWAK